MPSYCFNFGFLAGSCATILQFVWPTWFEPYFGRHIAKKRKQRQFTFTFTFKESKFEHAKNMFSGTCLKVTSAGKRHLGAVIGSQDYKNEYVNNLVTTWKEELETLSKIAEIQPQAAYSAYVHGF